MAAEEAAGEEAAAELVYRCKLVEAAVAGAVRGGGSRQVVAAAVAAVRFADEKDLAWCEVSPLLRLAERGEQLEGAA